MFALAFDTKSCTGHSLASCSLESLIAAAVVALAGPPNHRVTKLQVRVPSRGCIECARSLSPMFLQLRNWGAIKFLVRYSFAFATVWQRRNLIIGCNERDLNLCTNDL